MGGREWGWGMIGMGDGSRGRGSAEGVGEREWGWGRVGMGDGSRGRVCVGSEVWSRDRA